MSPAQAPLPPNAVPPNALSQDTLQRLAAVLESRRPAADGSGGNPQTSYVARLLAAGPDAFLKKIGEEATEVVLAAKDAQHGGNSAAQQQKIVAEMADLWFHCLVALAHYQLQPADVLAELVRREGLGGLDEKALRKAQARAQGQP